jgi:hypothetical protein
MGGKGREGAQEVSEGGKKGAGTDGRTVGAGREGGPDPPSGLPCSASPFLTLKLVTVGCQARSTAQKIEMR